MSRFDFHWKVFVEINKPIIQFYHGMNLFFASCKFSQQFSKIN